MSSPPSKLRIAAVVAFYMTAALVMVFVNKAVLLASPSLPLVFLLQQMVIAVILLHVASFFTPKVDLPTREELSLQKTKALAPVVLVNIIGLIFSTLCLRDVDASFFQVARGLQLPLTIWVSSISTSTRPSLRVILCAGLVSFGFLVGVLPTSFFTSPTFSLPTFASAPRPGAPSRALSLLYGVLSSLFVALHAVLIKSSLPHVDGSTTKLAWWTNAGSAAFLVPCIPLFGELSALPAVFAQDSAWRTFVWGSAVTGVFGFLLCVAGLLSIKVTSPVTHMFSSAARGVLQTLLGAWIFSEILTVGRASSILVILAGTLLYTWVKSQEAARPPPATDIEALRAKLDGNNSRGEYEQLNGDAPEEKASK